MPLCWHSVKAQAGIYPWKRATLRGQTTGEGNAIYCLQRRVKDKKTKESFV